MLTSLTKYALLVAPLLLILPASAAKFEVVDKSNEKWCFNTAQPIPANSPIPQCSFFPSGTVRVTITPEPGELPTKCYDNGNNGNFCMYSANLYIAAYYRGKWLVKNSYTWTPADISQIPATTAWPPWGGTHSMAYDVYAGEIDLNTSKAVPPPEGLEVWVGISPAGRSEFTPGTVARIYPVPK